MAQKKKKLTPKATNQKRPRPSGRKKDFFRVVGKGITGKSMKVGADG